MVSVRATWHPTLTVYRLGLISFTIGLSTAKAFASPTASVTIDWVIGVVFFLLVFFLSYYDTDNNAGTAWLFQMKALDGFRAVATRIRSAYSPLTVQPRVLDGPAPPQRIRPRVPTITGYRLLVTSAAIAFGTSKLYLSLSGEETAPKAIEWVYSVVVSLSLYWIGLYEQSPGKPIPWFFTENCAPLVRSLAKVLFGAGVMILVLWGIRSGMYLLFEAVMAINWYQVLLVVLLLAMTVIGIVSPALFQWLDLILGIVFALIDPAGFRTF